MKKILLAISLLLSIGAFSQSYTNVSGGWAYDALKSRKAMVPPKDTVHTNYLDTGSIASKNGVMMYYTGNHFTSFGSSQNLQQTLLIGDSTTLPIVWDTIRPRPGHNEGFSARIFTIMPLDTADTNKSFNFGISVTGGTASSTEPLHSNNVAYFGWNVTDNGAVENVGTPMIAMGMEQRWRPDSTIDNTEWHQVYGDLAGNLHRISSYTIDNLTGGIQYYQTIDNLSYKKSTDDSVYFGLTIGGLQFERFGDHANWSMSGDASGVQISRSGGSAVGHQLETSSFSAVNLPYSVTLQDINGHHSGSSILFTDSIGSLVTISTDRTAGVNFTTPTSSGIGMFFNPNNVLQTAMFADRTNFVGQINMADNPLTALSGRRLYMQSNGSYPVTARFDNNNSDANIYAIQVVVGGGSAGEANGIWFLGANTGGHHKMLHFSSNPAADADNYVVYSESAAQSVWTGWSRFGDASLTNPEESIDNHGFTKLDSLKASATENQIIGWNTSTHRATSIVRLIGTGTLDFGSTAAGASTDLTITVTGAVDGDQVYIGVPNASTLSNGFFTAWVSGASTITVRFTNPQAVGALDPASGTFTAEVIK